MERETFTSTKLQIRLYTDKQCTQPFDDGQSSRKHATKGYLIGEHYFSTKVSFKPPFYSCHTCAPEEISATFSRGNGNWYDDDNINNHKSSSNNNNNNANQAAADATDDASSGSDDYHQANDDVADSGSEYGAQGDDGNNRRLGVDIEAATAEAHTVRKSIAS
jgi:hypothetical protein